MASLIGRNELVRKGVELARDAERSLGTGNYEDAAAETELAKVYARLANSLGDDKVFV